MYDCAYYVPFTFLILVQFLLSVAPLYEPPPSHIGDSKVLIFVLQKKVYLPRGGLILVVLFGKVQFLTPGTEICFSSSKLDLFD